MNDRDLAAAFLEEALQRSKHPDPYDATDRWDILEGLSRLLTERIHHPGPDRQPEEYLDDAMAVGLLMLDLFPDVTPLDEETKHMHCVRETLKAMLETLGKERQVRLRGRPYPGAAAPSAD